MPNKIPREDAEGFWMAKNMNFHIAFPVNMELHNTNLLYAFPNQNMEFNITKIQKEIIAKLITILYNTKAGCSNSTLY